MKKKSIYSDEITCIHCEGRVHSVGEEVEHYMGRAFHYTEYVCLKCGPMEYSAEIMDGETKEAMREALEDFRFLLNTSQGMDFLELYDEDEDV